MKRSLAITLLVVLISLVRPAPASAGFWAWLEEWSGPGPFKGYTFMFTACVQDGFFKASPVAVNDRFHTEQRSVAKLLRLKMDPGAPSEEVLFRRLLANPDPLSLAIRMAVKTSLTKDLPAGAKPSLAIDPQMVEAARISVESFAARAPELYKLPDAEVGPGHKDERLWCGYVDQGFFKAPPNDARGFREIRSHLTDIGPSVRLHDGVDLGVGFGWVTFNGDGVTASPRMTVTPMRLVMRPALIAVPEVYRKRWMGLLSVYWKETFVVGKLNAADFGSRTDSFQVDGELIRSFGFNVDVTTLFPSKWGFK